MADARRCGVPAHSIDGNDLCLLRAGPELGPSAGLSPNIRDNTVLTAMRAQEV